MNILKTLFMMGIAFFWVSVCYLSLLFFYTLDVGLARLIYVIVGACIVAFFIMTIYYTAINWICSNMGKVFKYGAFSLSSGILLVITAGWYVQCCNSTYAYVKGLWS